MASTADFARRGFGVMNRPASETNEVRMTFFLNPLLVCALRECIQILRDNRDNPDCDEEMRIEIAHLFDFYPDKFIEIDGRV